MYFVYFEGKGRAPLRKKIRRQTMKKRHPDESDGDIFREVLD
jgi:hypothetical protein